MQFSAMLIALVASGSLVTGHGVLTKAVGDAGGNGQALGVDPATPRDNAQRNPGQQDSTRFKGANADTCGQTLGGGENDPKTQVAAMVSAGMEMPQITPGGSVDMTLHQVNGDGAGPYSCQISSSGTGADWKEMAVTTNVPGTNSRSKAKSTDFPLSAKVAADQTCTGAMGGAENMCMVRCMNAANAGPFGGCVPVQMAGANATAAAKARRDQRLARSFMA